MSKKTKYKFLFRHPNKGKELILYDYSSEEAKKRGSKLFGLEFHKFELQDVIEIRKEMRSLKDKYLEAI